MGYPEHCTAPIGGAAGGSRTRGAGRRETAMRQRMGGVQDRFQWGSYGFLGGLVVGVILGWLFNRVVGTILWVGLVVVIVLLAFTVWRWVADRGRQAEEIVRTRGASLRGGDDDAVEVDTYVVEGRTDRGERVRVEREER